MVELSRKGSKKEVDHSGELLEHKIGRIVTELVLTCASRQNAVWKAYAEHSFTLRKQSALGSEGSNGLFDKLVSPGIGPNWAKSRFKKIERLKV